MSRARRRLPVAWVLGLALAAGVSADEAPRPAPSARVPAGEESGPDAPDVRDPEPELCRRAIEATDTGPLEALRRAENDRWRAARTASRQGRRHLRRTLGGGPSVAARGPTSEMTEIADLQRRYHRAVREARVLCGCREARGDPLREDCEAAFRALQARPGFAPPAP